ncbi:MAG: hypothetical protein IPP74_05750 [Alphaproteobacteria bacterium]|nr:hypothetical protein [Alphaproteobacteria bacterium]
MVRKSLLSLCCVVAFAAGCTHQKVEVNQIGDADLSCPDLAKQIVDLKILKSDVDEKTGFSGRNVGMGLLFWPGIIVNEMNGSKALDLANERSSRLITIYEKRPCDKAIMASEDQRYQDVMKKKKEDQAKAQASSASSSNVKQGTTPENKTTKATAVND